MRRQQGRGPSRHPLCMHSVIWTGDAMIPTEAAEQERVSSGPFILEA